MVQLPKPPSASVAQIEELPDGKFVVTWKVPGFDHPFKPGNTYANKRSAEKAREKIQRTLDESPKDATNVNRVVERANKFRD